MVNQLTDRAPGTRTSSEPRASGSPPVLWHLKVSHYNEKARWALDYKRLPHVRRAVVPGRHAKIAQGLGAGRTLPVLELDGEVLGDSTLIIDALERRYPEPPLYPDDPEERRRALEIGHFFDEELGPYLRLLVLEDMLPDPPLLLGAFAPDLSPARRLIARAMYPLMRRRIAADFGIDRLGVERAWSKCRLAGERFAAELQPNGYLVGDGFTVADLTVAALFSPVVAPVEFPYPQPQRGHSRLEDLRRMIDGYGALEWTRWIYAHHRPRSMEFVG
jgi:glutathione S-transferase